MTTEQLEIFLDQLQRQYGNVSGAARKAGFSRHAAYDRKKQDPEFSKAWDSILAGILDDAERELYRRAVKGTLEPKFYKGKRIGSVRKFSDSNLQFLLKSKRPEVYRDKLDLDANVKGSLSVNLETEIDRVYGDGDTEE